MFSTRRINSTAQVRSVVTGGVWRRTGDSTLLFAGGRRRCFRTIALLHAGAGRLGRRTCSTSLQRLAKILSVGHDARPQLRAMVISSHDLTLLLLL